MKMRTEKRALDKLYKRRDRYEIPDWQREEVWPPAKKQKLIDSILRGWKLPKFYFLKGSQSPTEYEVVDGQQRLSAIYEFLDNELYLSEKSAKEFGGDKYENLPDEISDAFDDFEIDYDEITDASDKEIKEFFQRLQDGLPLTTSERLNSIHSKLRDFCKRQAGHVFFKETVRLTNKRYAHFDVLVKSAAIEIDGFNVGLRYDDLKGVFESSNNFSPNSIVAKRIKNALKFLHTALPNNISVLRNRSMIQSFINLACTIVESKADKGNEVAFGKFVAHFASELSKQVEMGHSATDLDYISFQKTVNANVRSGALTRHQIMVRKLLQFHPEFAEALTADSIAASGIKDYVAEIGGRISERITRVNEIYASTNGVDLFKPTNKTISSLSEIGKLISDFDGYKSFVDALYFLFWEGPGSKLSGSEPLSFKDVNDLRTALQHDVDHGKASKVKSKRKKLGSTFQKYSGALAPTAMSPDRFPVVQLAVLTAIESDLRALEGAL